LFVNELTSSTSIRLLERHGVSLYVVRLGYTCIAVWVFLGPSGVMADGVVIHLQLT